MNRALFQPLVAHLDKKEFTILTGACQTGKSTLLRQLEVYCKELSKPCVFLNLENRDILSVLDENPLNLLNYLPDAEGRIVAFLDEIQYLKEPSNFLKLLYDEHVGRVDRGHRKQRFLYRRPFQRFTCRKKESLPIANLFI